ncbi:MAG: hypothetical protein JO089_08455 [Alphaproteobacteria bacterium]|nr:hypothetical protein [Alphaproteobacteria bacterium]
MTRNVLLTGIPRCGTTLLTAFYDRQADAAALNEPQWQYDAMMRLKDAVPAEDYVKWLIGDLADIRRKLLHGVPLPERRAADGTAVTNYYRAHAQDKESREVVSAVPFTRAGLSQDFMLAVKHNGLYLGVLDALAASGEFTIVALVRHPVGAIASWNEVNVPIRQGRLPAAEGYWPEIGALAAAPMEILEKQVRLYDLLCARLLQHRQRIHLLRYEDFLAMIRSRHSSLAALGLKEIDASLIAERNLGFYDAALTERIARCYRRYADAAKALYPD